MDKYQKRYFEHQNRKKDLLISIIKKRHSDRFFSDNIIDEKIVAELVKSIEYCPSSCNRKAVEIKIVSDKDLKNLLGGILVGGIGWIHRASNILLIFAEQKAYKANNEINYMPYLDAGVIIQQLYLVSETLNLKCCFVNPNIRSFNIKHFKEIFGDKIFCGAFAIGK
jgi:nitroreductase